MAFASTARLNGNLMKITKPVVVATVILGLVLFAPSQGVIKPVSADDVLHQLDVTLLTASLDKLTPAQTLDLVKKIVMLNQMQVSHASLTTNLKESTSKEAEGYKALTANFNQSFYDLRRDICKTNPSRIVDLDGELHDCN